MESKSLFKRFAGWSHLFASFERNVERIVGKWELYEYYVDTKNGLINFKEKELISSKVMLVLSILENREILLAGKFPVDRFCDMEEGMWRISRNYITFSNPDSHDESVEFQFAFERGNLKLLNKNSKGEILFFGFFKKQKQLG